MNMAANTGNRINRCETCGHVGYSHFFDRLGNLAECHEAACKCLLFTVMSSSLDEGEEVEHFHDLVSDRVGGAGSDGSSLALASVSSQDRVKIAVALAKIVHDAQDEHGLKTRHDIGLVMLDKLGDGVTSWCEVHEHVPAMISDERDYNCQVSTVLIVRGNE